MKSSSSSITRLIWTLARRNVDVDNAGMYSLNPAIYANMCAQ